MRKSTIFMLCVTVILLASAAILAGKYLQARDANVEKFHLPEQETSISDLPEDSSRYAYNFLNGDLQLGFQAPGFSTASYSALIYHPEECPSAGGSGNVAGIWFVLPRDIDNIDHWKIGWDLKMHLLERELTN